MKRKGLDLALSQVWEFHKKFGHPAPPQVQPLKEDQKMRRIKWMIEEIEELQRAKSLEDQVDALLDLMYFTLGTFVEMGITNIQELFDIVHKANMSKLWEDGKPRFRKEDGKIIKPPTWVDPAPQIREILLKLKKEIPFKSTERD